MDAPGCAGHAQPAPGCAPWCPAATALLGLPGLMVTAVTQTGMVAGNARGFANPGNQARRVRMATTRATWQARQRRSRRRSREVARAP